MGYEIISEKSQKDKKSMRVISDDTIMPITDVSDTAMTIKELNDTSRTKDNKFSQIDMKSRLHPIEISAIMAYNTLIAVNFLPTEASYLTESKLRLAVSEMGKGRGEIVQIAQGMAAQKQGTSMFERMGNMFGGGNR